MTNRRDLLKGAVAAGGAAALGAFSSQSQANWGMPLRRNEFDGSSLINKAQAYRVMEEHDLDGLIAMNPVNVFYFGNYLAYNVKVQQPNPSFAIFPRDPKRPTILVVGPGDIWNLADNKRDLPEIQPYSAALNWQDYIGSTSANELPDAAPGFSNFFARQDESLSALEKRWVELDKQYEGKFMPTPEHALLKAVKEAGLEKAKVAVDDISIETVLASAGHRGTCCMASDNIFRKIRVVKSDVELKHMRHVAQINQDAALAMLQQIEVGATEADIDRLLRIEAAKRGASVTWAVSGSIGGLPNKEVVRGEPFLIDTVSQINYYHGDFGRSAVVGEPTTKLHKRTQMLNKGWMAALDIMKPGVRYSEIQAAAMKAMKGASSTNPNVLVVPHSVGLQHTDEPYRDNLPFSVKDDLILQEGMTLTVDFPSLEMGWGNCHLEDLVVITDDGVQPLATLGDPLVVI